MNFDLLLRYAIINVAISLACAWAQSFNEPWPLVHAFDLADTAQEQLFQSLGVRFGGSLVGGVVLVILSAVEPFSHLEQSVVESKDIGVPFQSNGYSNKSSMRQPNVWASR